MTQKKRKTETKLFWLFYAAIVAGLMYWEFKTHEHSPEYPYTSAEFRE